MNKVAKLSFILPLLLLVSSLTSSYGFFHVAPYKRKFKNDWSEWSNAIDRFFHDNDNYHWTLYEPVKSNSFLAIDVVQREKTYEVLIDAPGVDKDKLDVHIENGFLSVVANRTKEFKTESGDQEVALLHERFNGKISRKIALPKDIQEENIEAEQKNGVVKVTIPRMEKEKKKLNIVQIE